MSDSLESEREAHASSTLIPVVCAGVVVADHLCTPIDHLPVPGELVKTDSLLLNIGGGACNTAMDLVRLGVRSSICGKVGDDVFGRFVAETLNSQGIGTEGLGIDPERATSQTLIVNVKGEDRRFIHSFGANEGFAIEDLDLAIEKAPRVFFLGYLLILPNLDTEALAKRLARLRDAGTLVVIDVATPGPGDYLSQLEPVLPHTDVFLPNTDEARLILGESDPIRQAEIFHEMGAKRVVITRGEFGAVAVSDRLRVKLGTFAVPFVDGSGGGDAFDAGYITAHLDGRDELGCLTYASAIGASCVRAVGTTTGVFNRREADAFLASQKLSAETF